MKKILFIYIGILVAVFMALSSFDRDGDYAIERKLWRINKKFVQIRNDPSVVPDKHFNDVIREYQDIIESSPESQVIKASHFLVGQLYEMKGDYKRARKVYEDIIKKYSNDTDMVVHSLSQMARVYEIEDNEAEAMSLYQKIVKEYPLTDIGLSTPIYVANYYKAKNDYQKSMDAYQRAIQFYKDIASENPDSVVEFNSLRFLANCYLDQNRWEDAIQTLEDVLLEYSGKKYFTRRRMEMTIKTINLIAAYELKNNNAAVEIYKKFIKKYPEHPYNESLKKMIEVFKEVESQGEQQASIQK